MRIASLETSLVQRSTDVSCALLTAAGSWLKGIKHLQGIKHSCRADDILHLCSCCRDVVDAIVRKKRAEMDAEADFELKELNKIKVKGACVYSSLGLG